MEPTKKLLLLDAYALIFRAFYAMIRSPRVTSTGIDTSAVFGFVNTLQDLLKREQPSHIAVCFDPPGGKTFRHESYEPYKANREKTPEGILVAVPYIKRILKAYRIPIFEVEGYEADDVIGTLSHQAEGQGFFTYMVTGDKDFGQLVTPNIKIFNPGKNEIMGVEEIKEKYGIQSPTQLIDILGLMGDSADNIPGCPGVGPKTAEKLIQQYGSVENMLEHTPELKGALKQRVEENAEQIRMSKWLATIITDVPVMLDADALRREPVDMDALREVFNELEFRTLTQRLIDGGEANANLEVSNVNAEMQKTASQPQAANNDLPKPQKNVTPRKPTASGQQLSLFDMDEPSESVETAPATPSYKTIADVPAHYRLVDSPLDAAMLVSDLIDQPRVAMSLLGTGDSGMQFKVMGIALCAKEHEATFVKCDDKADMLKALAPLFTSKTCIVSNDVKRTMVALHRHGIEFTAPYYDTAVAHYLLQPERGHSIAEMAYELLRYTTITPESILGPKGRKQLDQGLFAPEMLTRWACEAADLTLQLPDVLDTQLKEQGLDKLLNEIELPLVKVLASMEIAGARIDVKALKEYSITLTEQMNRLDDECHRLAGIPFNTASPAQVGEVLFDHLKIDPKAKKTKTGQYSTTEDILLKLRDRHPLVDKILELRGIRKLLSTYVNALPALINPQTGRIHTTYNQTVTATGRLSSTNPNLQNIPVRSDDGKEIRRAFIPADGNVFFSADYSQIELRLVADLSQDKTMLDAFAHGHDIHAITAARIYHKPLEQVTGDERRKAKTANFGILYGISAFGLAQRLNIPRDEAKMLIDGYYTTFPQVRDYIDRSIAQAKEKGYVTTLYGRRRMLPDINSRNAVVRAFSERNAINAPIQGTAADVIKLAMVRIYHRFQQEGIQSKMILQVHDELNFDVIPNELERVQRIVIEEMEGVYHGNVKLTASHGAASNWLDAH
ncbi:MAG: DNA polymerase I [Muribaculaceae bacterium]|nr:DNA polymerase I [Muribaculaceae bacterium]